MIAAARNRAFFGNCYFVRYIQNRRKFDNSKRPSCAFVFSGDVVCFQRRRRLFSAATSFVFSGDMCVTLQLTSLSRKCLAVRFALLASFSASSNYLGLNHSVKRPSHAGNTAFCLLYRILPSFPHFCENVLHFLLFFKGKKQNSLKITIIFLSTKMFCAQKLHVRQW